MGEIETVKKTAFAFNIATILVTRGRPFAVREQRASWSWTLTRQPLAECIPPRDRVSLPTQPLGQTKQVPKHHDAPLPCTADGTYVDLNI